MIAKGSAALSTANVGRSLAWTPMVRRPNRYAKQRRWQQRCLASGRCPRCGRQRGVFKLCDRCHQRRGGTLIGDTARRLTAADVASLRQQRSAGASLRELARTYRLSHSRVHDIVRGKAWRQVMADAHVTNGEIR